MRIYKNKIAAFGIAIIILSMLTAGCSPFNRTQRGATIGAGAGATVGAVIGKTAGNMALGAIIGGAVGGTAGAYIAHQIDNQASNIKQTIPGAKVIREDGAMVVKFDSGILFDQGSTDLKPDAQTDLKNLAASMQANPQTNITIIGHTDSLETVESNMNLSQKRADAVKAALVADGVSDTRLTATGKGTADPIADNKTPEGRAQNRRVVIVIAANNDMKDQAVKSGK